MSVFGVILVHIFQDSDRIRRDTEYLPVFSPNAGKCGPVLSRNSVRINTEGHIIYKEKLLRVKIDSQLLFESHVFTLCKKTCQKLMLFQELQTAGT